MAVIILQNAIHIVVMCDECGETLEASCEDFGVVDSTQEVLIHVHNHCCKKEGEKIEH